MCARPRVIVSRMSLTAVRLVPAFLLGIVLSAASPAIYAAERQKPVHPHRHLGTSAERLGLYSARVRRSTLMYLRLRLLELHEQGLDRARAAVERRMSVDELIYGPVPPPVPGTPRGR